MRVPEHAIAQLVGDASTRLQDPVYISAQVDRLAARQPAIMHYLVAHKDELSVETIVQLMFQIALIQRSVALATGATPPVVDFKRLDLAASATPTLEALATEEPDLASFIHSNLDFTDKSDERELASRLLAHVAKALVG